VCGEGGYTAGYMEGYTGLVSGIRNLAEIWPKSVRKLETLAGIWKLCRNLAELSQIWPS